MTKTCLECKKLFEADRKTRTFCSQSCSASYNNRGVDRHGNPEVFCRACGKVISKSKKYCDLGCMHTYQYQQYIDRWLRGEETGNKGAHQTYISNHVRRWVFETRGNSCEKCGWSEIHPVTGNIPLEVTHKDGNWKNTVPDNLELLCPNCHSLTDTHGSLNTGNGRRQVLEGKRVS